MDEENIINFDNQGFPICKMSIREILGCLGAELKDGKYSIEDSVDLDIIPELYEDDGMGYGVNKKFITSFTFHPKPDYATDKKYCTAFCDNELENIDLWKNAKFFPYAFVVKKKQKGRKATYFVTNIKKVGDIVSYHIIKEKDKNVQEWVEEDDLDYE